MAQQTAQLVILFADVAGSTKLYESLGDNIARATVSECIDVMSAVTTRHRGRVIKTIGDEVMCTFPDVECATTAACEMHEGIGDIVLPASVTKPVTLAIRIGMHYGPAILEDGDVFGDAVNLAARMASQSKAGQIITTQGTVERMSPILKAAARFIDRAPIKGKKDTIDIYEVIWQQEDVTRMVTGVNVGSNAAAGRMVLSYGGRSIEVNADRSSAVLGRSATADMTVEADLASRLHVRIEYRKGRFFIVDQSTNGTYVLNAEDEKESFVRREEMPLEGHGRISLGRPFHEHPADVVEFRSER